MAAGAVVLSATGWALLVEPPPRDTPGAGAPLVIAHRGFGNLAPDNSLAAVRRALDSGVDGVDMDAQLSADGHVVVFHDFSVDRLTDGSGRVRDLDLGALKALDLGVGFDSSFAGQRIPTLDEVIRTIDGRMLLMVELKVTQVAPTGIEEKVARLIADHDAFDWIYITAFNPVVLGRMKAIDPRVRTVFAFMDSDLSEEIRRELPQQDLASLPWPLRKEPTRRLIRRIIGPDVLSIKQDVQPRTIERLIDHGHAVFLWTPDTWADAERALARRPYGIITNEPLMAIEVRSRTRGTGSSTSQARADPPSEGAGGT